MKASIEHTGNFLQKLIDYATETNDKKLYLMVIEYIELNSTLIVKEIIEREQIIDLIKNN